MKILKNELTFGEAIEILKTGGLIARLGWNGKNMYLYLSDTTPTFQPFIVMKTADGKFQPGWLASQADILAEDWLHISAFSH